MRIPTVLLAALPVLASAQGSITPARSTPVTPYTAKTVQPVKAKSLPQDPRASDNGSGTTRPATPMGKSASAFVGTWQLAVEGATYTTDNFAAGTRTTTTSAGAMGRRLVIRADGTYDWGGTKGLWAATSDGGYPLVLRKADHGHDWKVGWDDRRNAPAGRIIVWDGYVYEIGTAIK